MKKYNLAGMIITLTLLATFTFSIESCQKLDWLTGSNDLAKTKRYPSDVATTWFNLLTDITKTKPYNPPPTLRIFAYSGIALYESVVPGMPSYQSMYKHLTGNSIEVDKKKDYYWPACANAAIARIASKIIQNYPSPDLVPLQALEDSLNRSFQLQATYEQLRISNEFGRHVADVIYEWSKKDGTLNPDESLAACPAYVPLTGKGNWVPTPPAFLPAAGACQGSLRTFIPNIANAVLPPPHPAYSTDVSSDFYKAANQVYEASMEFPINDLLLVNNWRDWVGVNYGPPAHMLRLATGIIAKEKTNLEDASVLFAKQTMAAFDAIAAAANAKFHYALLRPITYIRDVIGQKDWNAVYATPQLPSYCSFQSLQASTVEIFERFYGKNYALVDSVHKSLYDTWSYPSLDALLYDIGKSALKAGTYFKFSVDAGITQGRRVGAMIDALPFRKP